MSDQDGRCARCNAPEYIGDFKIGEKGFIRYKIGEEYLKFCSTGCLHAYRQEKGDMK